MGFWAASIIYNPQTNVIIIIGNSLGFKFYNFGWMHWSSMFGTRTLGSGSTETRHGSWFCWVAVRLLSEETQLLVDTVTRILGFIRFREFGGGHIW